MTAARDEARKLAEKVKARLRWDGGDHGNPYAVLDALVVLVDEAMTGWDECRRIGSHRASEVEDLKARVVQLQQERDQLAEALARAAFVAEHLHAMIPQDAWRDSGGDDGQGHYEGDFHAEKVAVEIAEWAALAASRRAGE